MTAYNASRLSEEAQHAKWADQVYNRPETAPAVDSKIAVVFKACLVGLLVGGLSAGIIAGCHAAPWAIGTMGGCMFVGGALASYAYFKKQRKQDKSQLQRYNDWDSMDPKLQNGIKAKVIAHQSRIDEQAKARVKEYDRKTLEQIQEQYHQDGDFRS